MKAKYMELQYSKGKSLIRANEEVLIFNNLSYLKLDDIHDNSSEVVELNTFQSLDQGKFEIIRNIYIFILPFRLILLLKIACIVFIF